MDLAFKLAALFLAAVGGGLLFLGQIVPAVVLMTGAVLVVNRL